MIIETMRFGSLDVEEKDIIEIIDGLLGFEETRRYVLFDHDSETPLKWLQAVDNPELAFVVMEPFIFCPDYEFDLSHNEVQELKLSNTDEAAVLVILVVPDDPKKITANIKAPIVINRTIKKGKQLVLNNEAYPVKFYLFQGENKGQGGR